MARTARVSRLAATASRRWFLDRHAEFWLGELHAGWSRHQLRGRVIGVHHETADTRTFVLATPRRWPGHTAGQYVPLTVEVAGVRLTRCYSISSGDSTPGAGTIAITVRHVPGGKVSSWLHANVVVGDALVLGAPAGDFVLPASTDEAPLLFVAAGSGITPIAAMLRALYARTPAADAVVIHAARRDADAILGRAIAELAALHPSLRVIAPRTRVTSGELRALVPDLAARATYVCGPHGLIELVRDVAPHARYERFVPPPKEPSADALITLGGRTVLASGPGSLLDQLERAGERPKHGCRMGICNTCRCTKLSGPVEDLASGKISSEPGQQIRLCTSVARGDLELAL